MHFIRIITANLLTLELNISITFQVLQGFSCEEVSMDFTWMKLSMA